MTSWEFEHSVFTEAKREYVWNYWTNMDNHAKMETSVESIELDGPFESGTKGRTITKDYTQEWELRNVIEGKEFTIFGKTADEKGFLSFSWTFNDEKNGTRMFQKIAAEGPQVEEFLPVFKDMEKGAVIGMDKLVKELDRLHNTV